ncbi:phosphonate ABC transporter ATP-binding protein (plasmid) [Haloarcula salina]|uniref:phosphonate ABC transporter ATP-binding protein n=1 Tax=Haloarcula salina TaxID=1429914 RepID=UPI003C701155
MSESAGRELVFDRVTRRFDGEPALSDVSLRFAPAEHVAVVGPSGAGKTTLLRLASGALTPDQGTITLGGKPVSGADVTLAYQGETLVDRRTALANVLSGRVGDCSWLRGFLEPLVPRDPEPALELLDAVGLAEKADARAATLSAGERQRVAFARALVRDAPVVLADEPTANLDPSSRANVIDVLDAVLDDELLVTVLHEVGLALDRFERIVGLAGGRVRFDEPAAEVTDAMLDDLFAAGTSTPDGRRSSDGTQQHRAAKPTEGDDESRAQARWYA